MATQPFQEPMTQGITYIPPTYSTDIDPNPPAYEELEDTSTSASPPQQRNLSPIVIDEKKLYRLSTQDRTPPHIRPDYNPALTGHTHSPLMTLTPTTSTSTSSSASYSTPLPADTHEQYPATASLTRLLTAITTYYTTHVNLNPGRTLTISRFERRMGKKLRKAEKKFQEHAAKGKGMEQYNSKMEKRAAKIERWTEWALKRAVEREERFQRNVRGAQYSCCGASVARTVPMGEVSHRSHVA